MSRFWFSSTMSSTVMDALACAMAQLVFSKDVDAVAQIEVRCVVHTDASSQVFEESSSQGKGFMESRAQRGA